MQRKPARGVTDKQELSDKCDALHPEGDPDVAARRADYQLPLVAFGNVGETKQPVPGQDFKVKHRPGLSLIAWLFP